MFNKLLKYNKIHENAILQFIIKGTNEKLGEEIHRGQEKSNVGKPLSLCNLGAKSSQFTTMFINWELLPNLFACELLISFITKAQLTKYWPLVIGLNFSGLNGRCFCIETEINYHMTDLCATPHTALDWKH